MTATDDRQQEARPDPRHGGVSRTAHRMRLPGFLIDDDIGLGDAIKRITFAAGIKPCSGCDKRAESLNRRITLTRSNRANR
jgi:hypothetical protein